MTTITVLLYSGYIFGIISAIIMCYVGDYYYYKYKQSEYRQFLSKNSAFWNPLS